jgi:hypothetical protein
MAATRTMLLTAAILPALCGSAQAVTLYTPFVRVFANQYMRVDVTNLNKAAITVTVTCTDAVGGLYTSAIDGCNGFALDPANSCYFYLAENQGAFCTVVSSSAKVRAAINVFGPDADGSPLVAVVPATK